MFSCRHAGSGVARLISFREESAIEEGDVHDFEIVRVDGVGDAVQRLKFSFLFLPDAAWHSTRRACWMQRCPGVHPTRPLGSPTVTTLSSTTNLAVGMLVTGNSIPCAVPGVVHELSGIRWLNHSVHDVLAAHKHIPAPFSDHDGIESIPCEIERLREQFRDSGIR
jgi:predicted RNA-binding protein with TRAM domain